MRPAWSICLGLLVLTLTACGRDPACPAGSVTYFDDIRLLPIATDGPPSPDAPGLEAGEGSIQVDRIVTGPFCNLRLEGTVYVACDLQIAAWDEAEGPTFLEGCDFSVAPGTVVYVAAHHDAAYYKGCSCHTGE